MAPMSALTVASALEVRSRNRSRMRRINIEDGSGRRLGRSFGVKLRPTLIFLDASNEVACLVRPADSQAINDALARIDVA